MALYADIIIDISHSKLDQTFQYRIPPELENTLEPGDVVELPFGRGDRLKKGYVLRITPNPACPQEKIKMIVRRVTEIGNAESKLTTLALWMRDYYGSTTVQALRTVLPFRSKASEKKKKYVVLAVDQDVAAEQLAVFRKKHQTARARLLEALLEEPTLPQEVVTGTLRITQPVLRTLEEMGIIRCESEQFYRTPAILEQLRAEAAGHSSAVGQKIEKESVVAALRDVPEGPDAETMCGIPEGPDDATMCGIPEGSNAETMCGIPEGLDAETMCSTPEEWDAVATCSVPEKQDIEKRWNFTQNQSAATGFSLTGEQRHVVDTVCAGWREEQATARYSSKGGQPTKDSRESSGISEGQAACTEYLIHGVTGSGKTAVYIELIAEALRRGKQAILLIPEISLTYQNVVRFYHAFGDRISILHSRISQAERYDQFERAKSGDIDVMIGPRSALFTPFEHLGLIIIDEEHESSYKSETTPRYDAREVARKRAALEGAILVLGSATPSLDSYYAAKHGLSCLLTMRQRPSGGHLAKVSVVDMRRELRDGNSSILSRTLIEKVKTTLEQGHQSMLFINRRGYSGFVSCRSCGHVIKCPHCDVSLSLHQGGRLICHYCGYEQPAVRKCPVCGSPFIGGFKAGTQQIEAVVGTVFPQARILRMDADTTRGKDGHAEILRAFGGHEADILIGTQMIVKGHDFPEVTLVGALAADLSLNVSDFRAAERTYQLLTQAAGRAGRGKIPGEVVIQTYLPDHYAITCAAAQTYEPFYEQEIAYRELSGYPPTGGLMSVHCTAEEKDRLEEAIGYLAQFARQIAAKYQAAVIGPADETVSKIKDVYRKVIYVRHKDEKALTLIKNYLERYIEMNRGFDRIKINFER